jgi:hypothetical protein
VRVWGTRRGVVSRGLEPFEDDDPKRWRQPKEDAATRRDTVQNPGPRCVSRAELLRYPVHGEL